MTERFTILRRLGSTPQPPNSPGTGSTTHGCERCRRLADNSEIAEGRRLEILRLQRRVQGLEEQLRQVQTARETATRHPDEQSPPSSPPWDETSPRDIPIEPYAQ
jgi:hypothetical protein